MGPQGAYLVNFLGSLIFSLDFIDPNRNGLNIKNTNYGMSLSLPQNLKINVFLTQVQLEYQIFRNSLLCYQIPSRISDQILISKGALPSPKNPRFARTLCTTKQYFAVDDANCCTTCYNQCKCKMQKMSGKTEFQLKKKFHKKLLK